MNNPEFDTTIIQAKHIALLREVTAGKRHWREGISHLLRRDLVENDGLHAVKVSGRGHFALRGILPGVPVRTTGGHEFEKILGDQLGVVLSINTYMNDADGWDQYGYVIKRAKPVTTVEVGFSDMPWSTWVFRNPEELVAYPQFLIANNDYFKFWRNEYVKGNTGSRG